MFRSACAPADMYGEGSFGDPGALLASIDDARLQFEHTGTDTFGLTESVIG